jgi:RNA-binding protein
MTEKAETTTKLAPKLAKLTGKQLRHLRALGHHLDPLVQLGKQGLTDGAKSAVNAALAAHELVKVRLGTECPDELRSVADRLGPELEAHVAQLLGRTLLLYRRHPKEPKIRLPATAG